MVYGVSYHIIYHMIHEHYIYIYIYDTNLGHILLIVYFYMLMQ